MATERLDNTNQTSPTAPAVTSAPNAAGAGAGTGIYQIPPALVRVRTIAEGALLSELMSPASDHGASVEDDSQSDGSHRASLSNIYYDSLVPRRVDVAVEGISLSRWAPPVPDSNAFVEGAPQPNRFDRVDPSMDPTNLLYLPARRQAARAPRPATPDNDQGNAQ